MSAVRQLANQDYHICFRSELVSGQVSRAIFPRRILLTDDFLLQKPNSICFAQCSTTNQNVAFRLTGITATSQLLLPGVCNNDFLLIANGFDPNPSIFTAALPTTFTDRFCGGIFNAAAAATSPGTVCCNFHKLLFIIVFLF